MIDYDTQAQQAIQSAPLPSPKTLKRRRNVFYQFLRFAAINIKMLKVIGASHGK